MGCNKEDKNRHRIDYYLSIQQCKAAEAFAQARCKRFLTSIRIWIVSALRLVQQREMVSQPPEKTHSMATAEPRCEDDV